MLSNPANAHPTADDESVSEADEPPDDRRLTPKLVADNSDRNPRANGQPAMSDAKKESLLTRALLRIRDFSSAEQTRVVSPSARVNGQDQANHNALSSTEVFSDDGTTNALRSQAPSFPHRTTKTHEKSQPKPITVSDERPESELEANLKRKRCIRFACGRNVGLEDDPKAMSDTVKDAKEEPSTMKRNSALTFVCPAPTTRTSAGDDKGTVEQSTDRKASTLAAPGSPPTESVTVPEPAPEAEPPPHPSLHPSKTPSKSCPIAVGGLGDFQPSEVTRFHEFGSSVEEDEDWVNEATQDKPKITLSDCMRKENAIRKLGEEVEAEAKQDEEEGDEDDDEDAEDDDNGDDDGDDGDPLFQDDYDELQTVHNDLSDDGNESDNEAGFASDDESEDGSEHSFWTPAMATAATSLDQATPFHPSPDRRQSISSSEFEDQDNTPLARRKRSVGPPAASAAKFRPDTPSLPDSTDFVCGTLDEDRPLEAAYKSCMEERRRSKYVTLPQDIDPSFPTSDLEDDGDDDDDDDDGGGGGGLANNAEVGSPSDRMTETINALEGRGRRKVDSSRTSPNQSPGNRQPSPPRKVHGRSPRRLRSPAPAPRHKSPLPQRRPSVPMAHPVHHQHPGINITGLAQRHTRIRTGSLPRTPNPFFARQEHTHRMSKTSAPRLAADDVHTRGAVDIVAGLEKKRQKRKEKFWRQHCRKFAKEQQERKPLPGRGAERMKELGLEVAERFRAYGFGQEAQLVLSI